MFDAGIFQNRILSASEPSPCHFDTTALDFYYDCALSNMKLLPSQRRREIKKAATKDGALRISELAKYFKVSEMTIRRDLEILEESGYLERTFGGAVLSEQAAFESSYSIRLETNVEAKKKIAKYAAGLIYDGDTVALDVSTSALTLAHELLNRDITVLTNSLDIAQYLRSSKTRVILSGGHLRQLSGGFVGPLALKTIEDLRVDHSFISAKGLSLRDGLFDSDLDEIEVKRAMIRSAAKVTAIIDSSKFGKRALGKIVDLAEIDLLVSDDSLEEKHIEALNALEIHYHLAGSNEVKSQ